MHIVFESSEKEVPSSTWESQRKFHIVKFVLREELLGRVMGSRKGCEWALDISGGGGISKASKLICAS